MSVQIKPLMCPRCGSGSSKPVAASPNLRVCSACGSEFVLSDNNAPRQVHVTHRLEPGASSSPAHGRHVGLAVGVVLLLAIGLPLLWPLLHKALPTPPDHGRLQASTVYQHKAGAYAQVQVLERTEGRDDHYSVSVSEVGNGRALGEPLQLSYPRTTLSQPPRFAHFSDGSILLIMNGQKLLALQREDARFTAVDDALVNRHPAQLGAGVSRIAPGDAQQPDSLMVTSNAGERFVLFWLSGQIVPLARLQADFQQRTTQLPAVARQQFAFARVEGGGDGLQAASSPGLLLRYTQRVGKGSYQLLPSLAVRRQDDPTVMAAARDFVALAGGWVSGRDRIQQAGLEGLQLIAPVQLRYRGAVLAANAQRVLIVFNTTPVTDQGRVLELLDATSGKAVWSRTLEQLPQITGSGAQLSADALPAAFYLRSNPAAPALLIDNDGDILHDFNPPAG